MSLVTVGELTDYMDITFTNTQERAALMVLEGLQMELETYLRRPVEVMTFREDYVVPHDYQPTSFQPPWSDSGDDLTDQPSSWSMLESFIYPVKNSPIVGVTSVTSTTPKGDATTLTEGTDFVVRRFGIEFFSGVGADMTLSIVYKAGLDGTDIPYFKLLILRAATREMQNMHDDTIGIKDLETRNVAPLETGFTDAELLRVKRYKRQRV